MLFSSETDAPPTDADQADPTHRRMFLNRLSLLGRFGLPTSSE